MSDILHRSSYAINLGCVLPRPTNEQRTTSENERLYQEPDVGRCPSHASAFWRFDRRFCVVSCARPPSAFGNVNYLLPVADCMFALVVTEITRRRAFCLPETCADKYERFFFLDITCTEGKFACAERKPSIILAVQLMCWEIVSLT
jgi:hypothetical protein